MSLCCLQEQSRICYVMRQISHNDEWLNEGFAMSVKESLDGWLMWEGTVHGGSGVKKAS